MWPWRHNSKQGKDWRIKADWWEEMIFQRGPEELVEPVRHLSGDVLKEIRYTCPSLEEV